MSARRLNKEDLNNLASAARAKRGYITFRVNPRTGTMPEVQFRSWKKLSAMGFAEILPNGGPAEELVITPEGRAALRKVSL